MKLAVTLLASILFACSVTTAKPVNPRKTTSATTSAEASTSTVIPSATKSTKSKHHVLSYKGSTFSVNLGKLSKDDVKLIKEYLEKDQKREEVKKARDSAKSEELNQKELVELLREENYELSLKYPNTDDPEYQEKSEIINQKLNEENEKLFSLQQKRLKLDGNLYYADDLVLDSARKKLAERLFQNGPSTTSLYSQIGFMKSNPSFVKNIYQSLILRLNKQSRFKKAFTSGTQNKSKHHKSPSSSSKTSTDQPTQTSSTQRASRSRSRSHSRSRKTSRSCSRSRKACSKMKNNLGSGWNQLENEDSDSD
ncbi:hypothetical protein BATDEDRAFT_21130 [Batrachochytrium dendrobatidis JAM81]|uniref:Uncharacterized protein n=1 Tax=Batrachochytrium dendrobatidis (strain JAM81 / FGSC 10211) TaxID=684364 RepID=F4NR97_BATDJ|nr:uncharacterized protein BATDEDRAFT_21130 [Batrachochytrium dendrobatidis JAM81]EGF83714.1 hypothetical protein BATDEDRAFT_21130 [Batrachochytrium dendrobatidis JAM81]|eukprot:XP_006675204.1 hypothetical protein BATDEDRAFT_21130 [Batrachochytrium dendrobatidis JAM81]